MSKGLSIHIGVNFVDRTKYGTAMSSPLSSNDANAMKQIADSLGYKPLVLLNQDATTTRVLDALGEAAGTLASGDILLLTYSGNGSQLDDTNGDEDDGKDETWCLYDNMLVDDQLDQAWTKFKPGVRIFVLSDSCHSGTILTLLRIAERDALLQKKDVVYRCLPNSEADKIYHKYTSQYDAIQQGISKDIRGQIQASVLLISACQDNQMASGGNSQSTFGVFTEALLQVWNNGDFRGNYKTFASAIGQLTGPEQSPNYYFIGQPNPGFEGQKPFTMVAP